MLYVAKLTSVTVKNIIFAGLYNLRLLIKRRGREYTLCIYSRSHIYLLTVESY